MVPGNKGHSDRGFAKWDDRRKRLTDEWKVACEFISLRNQTTVYNRHKPEERHSPISPLVIANTMKGMSGYLST